MNKREKRHPAIYGLHGGDGVYGYIGSTGTNIKTRWWEHRSRARHGHTAPVYDWIRDIGIENLRIETIEDWADGGDESLQQAEARCIVSALAGGHPLRNQMARDGVPNSNGDRMKKMLSEKRRGKPTWTKGKTGEAAGWTEERKRKQSEWMKAKMQEKKVIH